MGYQLLYRTSLAGILCLGRLELQLLWLLCRCPAVLTISGLLWTLNLGRVGSILCLQLFCILIKETLFSPFIPSRV